MLSITQLGQIMRNVSQAKRAAYLQPLNDAMQEFGITTLPRVCAFLAQIGHESGELVWMEELWGPTAAQRRYEPPSDLARKLGNTQKGDGFRFKGRGPIQITGRDNYKRYGEALGLDLIADPAQAASPEVAFRIAGLYWQRNEQGRFVVVGVEYSETSLGLEGKYLARVRGDVTKVVEAWRQAWEKAKLAEYMQYYADSASQGDRKGKASIREQKQQLWAGNKAPKKVGVRDLKMSLHQDGILVEFVQEYASKDGLSDKGKKRLVLAPVARAPNGKLDYKALKAQAIAALSTDA